MADLGSQLTEAVEHTSSIIGQAHANGNGSYHGGKGIDTRQKTAADDVDTVAVCGSPIAMFS